METVVFPVKTLAQYFFKETEVNHVKRKTHQVPDLDG